MMWQTNLKVVTLGIVVIGLYTFIARSIPQVQSEVPEELDLSSGFTAEALVSAGERIFNGAGGCTACHGLGTRAPNLTTDHAGQGTIGQRCGTRTGADCKAYLYQSLTDPQAYIVETFGPIMPDARRQLSEDQIWALVAFLQSQGGEVTVTAADIPADAGSSSATAPPAAAQSFSGETDAMQLLTANACLGCHMIDGTGGAVGPSFDGIGAKLTAAQLREAILDPAASLAEGFESMAGVMPPTFGNQLSARQLENIVTFLSNKR